MKRFRSHVLQMLVATDVAARGIDVSDITHVINYNLPDEIESYTHRSGRTARAGKKGISITLIGSRDGNKIRVLERLTKKRFTQGDIPDGQAICERQLFHLVQQIHEIQVDEKSIESYMPKIYDELKDLSKEDVIKRFVSTEFNRFSNYYKNAPDMNNGGSIGSYEDRVERKGVVKLFASLGELDGLDRVSLKEYVSKTAEIPTEDVSWVDVKKSFSFIEVKTEVAEKVLAAFKDQSYRGRPIRIESRGNSAEGIPRERNRGGRSSGRFGGGSRSGGSSGGGFRRREGSSGGGGFRRREGSSSGGSGGFRKEGGSGGFSRDKKKPFYKGDR